MRCVSAWKDKLAELGGAGPAKVCEERIKTRTGWHDKAPSAIRHMLSGSRKISADERNDIEAAYLRYCADKIKVNNDDNRRLYQTIRNAIAALEKSDPEFHRPQIEALREIVNQLGYLGGNQVDND